MKEISATEAGRRFSEILDAVEHGRESFVIRRHGKVVAQIAPAVGASWGDLLEILATRAPDDDFADDVATTRRLLVPDAVTWED